MPVSEDTLRENCRRLSDEKLLRIAAEDAPRLRPEALVLLKAKLQTRGLSETAEKAIAAPALAVAGWQGWLKKRSSAAGQ